jgi:Tol biopolymer transport system component
VNGNLVDGTLANLVRLTNTGGALVSGAPGTIKNPLKAWNPVSPLLAVLASDGVLYLVQTTTTGSVVTDVPGLSGVQELRWSPDGTRLAVSVGGSIVTITTGGAVNEAVKGVAGDLLRDLTWSPDGAWLLYRVTRGATCWLELKDVDAGVLTTPLAVTEGTGVGLLGGYRGVIPMNAAWTSADLIVFPVFGVDGVSLTPGIVTRDLSGAVD